MGPCRCVCCVLRAECAGRRVMASLLVMSDAARSAALVSSSAAAPSSCSSSLPIGAAPRRGAPANSLDFSAYLLSASPPGFELSRTAFSCGLPPSQRLSPPNAFQVIAIFIDTLPSACRVCVTVRVSVCPVDRQQQRWPAGLLLSVLRQEISIDSCRRLASRAPQHGAQQQMRAVPC